ncbi:MAG: hypothetical protein HY651_05360 [Acidobacteria bacterium]|nr:hypothetical protein [Acidobacteriota bacterium]
MRHWLATHRVAQTSARSLSGAPRLITHHLSLITSLFLLAAPCRAVIVFDASSEGTGTTSLSWTHAPVGTPKGVIVFCMNNTNSDVFSGATYGGTTMSQINSATDGAGEPGFTEAYFLGASIPSGSQTVVCTVSSGSTAKHGVAYTVTAASDTQTAGTGSCTVSADADDPSCSITSVAGASYAAAAMHSGQNAEGSTTAGPGFTIGPSNDYGTQTTGSERMTSQQSSGNVTVQFITAASDDVALVGVAIQQTVADAGHPPRRAMNID